MAGPLNTILPSSTISTPSAPSPAAPATKNPDEPDSDDAQPPRPSNSWILYRAWKVHRLPPIAPGQSRRTQGEVSSLISALWKEEDDETRAYFERQAELEKEVHRALYPNYKYRPKRREDKAKGKGKASKKTEAGSSRVVSSSPKAATPRPQRAGHPYPLSARPPREFDDAIGPSPPVSAACSPSTSNVALEPDPYFFVSGSLVSQSETPAYLPPTYQPYHPQTSTSDVNPSRSIPYLNYTQPSADEMAPWLVDPGMQSSGTSSAESNALYFDVPSQNAARWPASDNFSCRHPVDEEHDFNCFIGDIPSLPVEGKSSDVEVSVGMIPSEPQAVDFQALFTQEASFPYDLDFQLFHADDAGFPPSSLMGQFTHSDHEGSHSTISSTSVIPTDAAPYVPPTGASQSSTRRVAATWTQYVQALDGSAQPYEVPT